MSNSYQCPSCGKDNFKDHGAVARHMMSVRTADSDSMDVDHAPNIPDVDQELDGAGFGDWDGEVTPTDSDFIDWHPKPPQTYGRGHTFLDSFRSDANNTYRKENHYYPFSGRKDWEVALWLLHSG
ncbi:hypothetical protein DFJ58DRAFT_736255 [Suillus subalutaceus]|uniref:uncharacterized protein n=1 Tax=Suillus subalutaceus TaxID=48586 RepID=UPI001B885D98|nr:uncharacterized protein DFJ58DRAFT_736255 [Suillus subalutaceus]KAG1832886.1 hypothetical protein DFJ58DRAFT_736255 [Suillus subalutaceus]